MSFKRETVFRVGRRKKIVFGIIPLRKEKLWKQKKSQ